MTVMETSTRRLTIGTLLRRAAQLAGLLEPTQELSQAMTSLGVDMLEITVDELQSHGVFARSVSFYELPLELDVYRYDLPLTALDAVGEAMYVRSGETVDRANGETIVTKMDREQWQAIGSKSARGRPTRYYVHRELDTVQVRFWPIPDEAGTVRFQLHRRLADNTALDATVDLETFWQAFLVNRMAALMAEASSLPSDKIVRLESKASAALTLAKNMANQQEPNQAVLDHRTGWR